VVEVRGDHRKDR